MWFSIPKVELNDDNEKSILESGGVQLHGYAKNMKLGIKKWKGPKIKYLNRLCHLPKQKCISVCLFSLAGVLALGFRIFFVFLLKAKELGK